MTSKLLKLGLWMQGIQWGLLALFLLALGFVKLIMAVSWTPSMLGWLVGIALFLGFNTFSVIMILVGIVRSSQEKEIN